MAADFDFEGMDNNLYFDRAGKNITMEQWAELSSTRSGHYLRVARSQITDLAKPDHVYRVSTIWTGLNLALTDDRPPLIFETVVRFPNDPTDSKSEVVRYASETQAHRGHEVAVAEFSSRCSVPHVEELP